MNNANEQSGVLICRACWPTLIPLFPLIGSERQTFGSVCLAPISSLCIVTVACVWMLVSSSSDVFYFLTVGRDSCLIFAAGFSCLFEYLLPF